MTSADISILIFYIGFAILALGYVVINAFHFIRFNLPLRGDLSLAMLFIYLFIVAGILVGSIIFGFIAYNV